MGFWTGRKVYVVGGSKGIGRAAAHQMAKAGAHVAVGARGQAELDQTLTALRQANPQGTHLAVQVDVADRASVDRARDQVLSGLGGCDVLVLCTGYAATGVAIDMSEDAIAALMNVNYMGHVRNVLAFGDHFRRQGSGHICLVTSMVAYVGFYGFGPYGASKAAIVQFGEALRQEMKEHGVSVEVFFPPTTDTPGLAQENETKPDLLYVVEHESALNQVHPPEKVAQKLLQSVEQGRFYNIATKDSLVQVLIVRHLPRLYHWLADDELGKARKKIALRRAQGKDARGNPIGG